MIRTKISFELVEDTKKQEDILVKSNGGKAIERFNFGDVKKDYIENIKEAILEEFEFKDLAWIENLQIEAVEVEGE